MACTFVALSGLDLKSLCVCGSRIDLDGWDALVVIDHCKRHWPRKFIDEGDLVLEERNTLKETAFLALTVVSLPSGRS